MPQAVVVIPARFASTRFPGKVLATLAGRPLVVHACHIASRARQVDDVIVATDDERVTDVVRDAGFRAVLTSETHASGTDRVAAVARTMRAEIVIGLQADEPFLAEDDLDALVSALDENPTGGPPSLATLSAPLRERTRWLDPNVVKVVTDDAGRALYFSRSPLPYRRARDGTLSSPPEGDPPAGTMMHVGVYGWRRESLLAFAELPPSALERAEGLEQLRALAAGWRILVLPAKGDAFGIDTPEDLERAERRLAEPTRTDER
ncbi:MAG: 3-deoxy-manno-octulosonate cytidylyltransferase [Acidobacteriota bacterium]|nr:3-deoxy-manno-octulosonate cytidylyltransferase [Acidobacteriota bacterium]